MSIYDCTDFEKQMRKDIFEYFFNFDAYQWDIAHAKPDFDYKPHVNCADYNGASNTFCQKANPCGKADEMQRLWFNDVKAQLRGNKPHMVLTMCHKDGAWSDDKNTKPGFDTSVSWKHQYMYIYILYTSRELFLF